jgi:hypothetical protein
MEKAGGGCQLTMTTVTQFCHSTINSDEPLNAYFAPTKVDELTFTYKNREEGQN